MTLETFSHRSEQGDRTVDNSVLDVTDMADPNDVTHWHGYC